MLRVGACQTPEYLGDVEAGLVSIEDFAGRADVDLLLFPECFLQGYYDTQFAGAAAAVAAQGARRLLVPAQNMLRRENADRWTDQHNQIRAERVRETGLWLVSADVTGARDADRVGYGPTGVMNPRAAVVAQVPLLSTGFVVAEIPAGGGDHSPGSPPEGPAGAAETAYHVVCPAGAAQVRRTA